MEAASKIDIYVKGNGQECPFHTTFASLLGQPRRLSPQGSFLCEVSGRRSFAFFAKAEPVRIVGNQLISSSEIMATLDTSLKVISALAARTQLGQIMRRARTEQTRFVVDRRGEPQVVIMGIKDFLNTIAPEKKVLAAIRAEARKKGKNKLSQREIDREIRSYRRERSL
jgi:prevent-host-death family protein